MHSSQIVASNKRETVLTNLMQEVARREKYINYDFEYRTGLNKKDGFLSSMFHVKLFGQKLEHCKHENKGKVKICMDSHGNKIQKHCLCLLIKFAPSNEQFRQQFPVRVIFGREKFFYDTYIPTVNALFNKWNMPCVNYVAKMYASTMVEYHEGLVFDNLLDAGFELYDYRKPMTHEHIKFVLETYGKHHAAGFALRHFDEAKYQDTIKDVKVPLFAIERNEAFLTVLKTQLSAAIGGLDAVKDAGVVVALKNHLDIMEDFICRDNYSGEDQYFTLIHGDCWCNNMMFKYDKESSKKQPSEIRLVDWQLLCHGPPTFDLSYFFYTNVSPEMYENLNEYMNIYYGSLSEVLRKFGLDSSLIYPRSAFEEHIKLYFKYGMTLAMTIFYIKLYKDDIKDHEDMKESDQLMDQFCDQSKDLSELHKMTNTLFRHCYKFGFL